ncbi:hypothetical protein HVTV-2_gp26 [Haloarcula virus HVTV-2]|uniref:Uncharacterized protein n=1 Tax=Haloarcula vallismortis tailed virus 1 TaxID=1262528 RepID=L7THS6_9CAUD|nr:hypothetical protein HVTV1_26 [Haloarcula vallismortis tailed virus 1]AGC34396.1 hypothetical protein HVTV1_26 [Haloarcula vallismortis tailed virus 1]UBF22833.1 hypothetical protein HVTV-2_gp26 [Haloarcula virus HVTV-2]
MGRTHIEVEDDRAFERARDMLNAADIDPEAVSYIEISVVYTDEEDTDESTSLTPEEDEEDESPTGDDEPDETTETREREAPTGGGGPAPGQVYEGERYEGAVMPGTHRARVLNVLLDHEGEWMDARQVFEEVEHPDTDYDQAKGALSGLSNKTPYLRKREKSDYGHREPRNEYQANEAGEQALAAGRELAAGEKMT